jgi:hypothetical protein
VVKQIGGFRDMRTRVISRLRRPVGSVRIQYKGQSVNALCGNNRFFYENYAVSKIHCVSKMRCL